MPRRASNAVKKGKGTFRPSRVRGPEVAPLTRVPPAPKHLTDRAAEHWKSLGRECVRRKTISSGDMRTLEEAAKASALIDSLHTLLEDAGPTESTRDGSLRPSSVYREIRAWTAELRNWLKALGLTPAGRSGVEPVEATADRSDFAEYILQGGIKPPNPETEVKDG